MNHEKTDRIEKLTEIPHDIMAFKKFCVCLHKRQGFFERMVCDESFVCCQGNGKIAHG